MTIKHTQPSWRTSGVHKPESIEKATNSGVFSGEKHVWGKAAGTAAALGSPSRECNTEHAAPASPAAGKGLEPSWKTNPAPERAGESFPARHKERSPRKTKLREPRAGPVPPAGLYGSGGRVLEPPGSAQRGRGGSAAGAAQHGAAREQRWHRRDRPGGSARPAKLGRIRGMVRGWFRAAPDAAPPPAAGPGPQRPPRGPPAVPPRAGTGAHLRCRPSSR